MFDYTRGSYWGGAHLSFGVFAALAVFPLTGLLGIEQLYLRNPLGMLIKIIGNIFTLGYWYFFDIAQLISDSANIRRAGIQYPLMGPTGIGAGIFVGSEDDPDAPAEAPEDTPQSWKWIVFAILTLLPFGGEHFFVGDTSGGIFKAIATFTWFLWPVAMLLSIVNIFKAWFGVDGLFKTGLFRIWPLSSPFSLRGKIGPTGEASNSEGSGGNFLSQLIAKLLESLSTIPFVGPIIAKVGGVAQTAVEVAGQTVTAAATLGQTAVSAAAQAPVIAAEVTGELASVATPEGLKKLAAEQGVTPTAPNAANNSAVETAPDKNNTAATPAANNTPTPNTPAPNTVKNKANDMKDNIPSTKQPNVVKQIGKGMVGGSLLTASAAGASDSSITVGAVGFIVVALLLTAATSIVLKMNATATEELKDVPPEPTKDAI
jgi:hypothetical protein